MLPLPLPSHPNLKDMKEVEVMVHTPKKEKGALFGFHFNQIWGWGKTPGGLLPVHADNAELGRSIV